MTRRTRVFGASAKLLAAIALMTLVGLWLVFRSSLPGIDGSIVLPGLRTSAQIERDDAGVPTLLAADRTDLARALGFVHAQDRFFEMDLMRRAAAGELSALLGPSQLPVDRQLRLYQFRKVARSVVAGLDPPTRALLDAYVAGVNVGLASLRSRPFEYWLLQSLPKAWTAEDSVLCVHAMYLQLQDSQGHRQLQRGLLHAMLPDAAWQFIEAGAPEWDATVDGTRSAEPRVPRAAEFDLRGTLPLQSPLLSYVPHANYLGSNNWAIAGTHTATGAGLIANDMHLNLRVPTIWYRARMVLRPPQSALDVTGVTLPGTPLVVAGSNGSVAWGFTNSYGEFLRVIRLMPVAGDPGAYMAAGGPRSLVQSEEIIEVRGAPSERLRVVSSEWGPVIGEDWEGRPYAVQWSARDPDSTNLNLVRLERAHDVDEALRAASSFGIPGQNLMVADSAGHIGWTIAGRLPIRSASDGLPQASTDAVVGFTGWRSPAEQPRVADPESGLLWSANARVVGGPAAAVIGDDGMDRGARASQIRDDLQDEVRPFTPAASLAVQLDDKAVFLERWRLLLSQLLTRQAPADHSHDEARATLAAWSGHAAPQDAAYRLVAKFREEVATRAFAMLVTPARRRAPNFAFETPSAFEGPLWRLLEQRPLHLLTSDYVGWDAFLLSALTAAEKLPSECRNLHACTWGTVNKVRIAHPLSGALPGLAWLIDMPPIVVSGGLQDMPRVQGRHFGASERFSVSPGRESEGYFEMPGAQSGHPLSPFYRTGFEDWARGVPAPFLPGPSTHKLTLIPR